MLPLLTIPPANNETPVPGGPNVLWPMEIPTNGAVIVPLLVIPPRNVRTPWTVIPVPILSTEMVPVLTMLPAKVLISPKPPAVVPTAMPNPADTVIVPVLTMLPPKIRAPVTIMPPGVNPPDDVLVIVPVFVMPPVKVSTSTKMPAPPALIVPVLMMLRGGVAL